MVLVFGGLFAALGVAYGVRVLGSGTETTDNAVVETRIVGISSETSGLVRDVLVKEHEHVEAGAPLMQLDTASLDFRLARARAELSAAVAGEEAARTRASVADRLLHAHVDAARGDESSAHAKRRSIEAETKQAEANLRAAQAKLDLAQAELDRTAKLHGDKSLSTAQLDEARARAANAEAERARAQAIVAQTLAEQAVADGAGRAARAKVDVTIAGASVPLAESDAKLALARVEEARAAVALAELERGRAMITAPFAGVVERRRVEPGSFVAAGAEHFLLVTDDKPWVEASFKEAQVGRIVPGQRVTIELDAFPGLALSGQVASIGGATLSRTSLVQTGGGGTGFARAAQRVPVTITLDKIPDGLRLASGLNATVSVRVK